MKPRILLLALAATATAWAATEPGPQADGSNLLHNLWPIRPVGRQVPLGEFPVAAAVDPDGRRVAILHAGDGGHEVRIVDIASGTVVAGAPVREAYCGVAFSADGRSVVCSGASEGVLHVFTLSGSVLAPSRDVRVFPAGDPGVVAGFALSRDGRSALVAVAFDSRVIRVDLATGAVAWTTQVGAPRGAVERSRDPGAPNDVLEGHQLLEDADPLNVAWDERSGRAYVSLWGKSSVAVIDAAGGRVLANWDTGLHPNELLVSPDGRLFVSNGGQNSVTVLDARDGRPTEVLCSAASPGDPPGSTPDSLALAPDGLKLYVANAYTNSVAVFDVSAAGASRPLGFIPTGWFPTSVRVTPDGRSLLVVSARGLTAKSNGGKDRRWEGIARLYKGSLGIVALPEGEAYGKALSEWTAIAQRCRPAATAAPAANNPIPAAGGASPIRYVVYIIKENRTYDQVLGDMPAGNGDPAICLFPEKVTPNIHAIARQFVLLDNFFANAEVSASGHEWSMAGYSSEFVEKSWPVNYGHLDKNSNVPYPAEGHYAAALPQLGYLWDRAAAAGVTYRSYGEFAVEESDPNAPIVSNLPALKGHMDPKYKGWDIGYRDRDRASEFISELRRCEAAGEMPRLQILRLPQDHTAGARKGSWTPEAMVADNDEALGRIVDALSHSRFWPQLAVFVVEDDAQSGPDHVDAHRTEALVAGPFVRRGVVDSTPYTTCSMVRTIELILGLSPMSQFDAAATPMFASFRPEPDLAPFSALAARIDTEARNTKSGKEASLSARFDFTAEDRVDDQVFNRVIWATVRGAEPMPAPVHAAFVRQLPGVDDDD